MTEEISSQLESGLRKNKGKQLKFSWLSKFSNATGINVAQNAFLSLEETERLKKAFYERIATKEIQQLFWDGLNKTKVAEVLRITRGQFSDNVILFSNDDYYLGAVVIPSDLALDHAFRIMEVLNYDLAIATLNLEDGLLLELNHFGHQEDGRTIDEYRLVIWGRFSLETQDAVRLDGKSFSKWD